jgi:hypothetical protein
VALFERSYAVDDSVKCWLIANVLDDGDAKYVREIVEKTVSENMGAPLPTPGEARWAAEKMTLPSQGRILLEKELDELIRQWNFYDSLRNTSGSFVNHLVDMGDGVTVIDERTGLQWQIGGLDICSLRMMNKKIEEVQAEGWAGFHDWRLPSMEEAMSLMNASLNFKGVYLNPCFSIDQPFVFVAARRKPGGYWFVDYKQGRAFWSSGTIPGGFGRLCRNLG